MNELALSNVAFITEAINSEMKRSVVQPDDVLLNITGASIGRVARFALRDVRANVNQHVCIVRPLNDRLDSRFLTYYLSSPQVQHDINHRHQHGGTRQALTFAQIAEFQIPLPPLSEQKRIADILDKADAVRRKRQTAIDVLTSVPESLFHDMFGDPATNENQWNVGTIRDLVSEVKYGTSSKAGTEGQYPVLRMNNITYRGSWDLSDLKYIDIPDKDTPQYLVRKGDLLFNRTNSKKLVGKTAVFEEEATMAYAGYLVRARTNEKALPEYVSGYLNSRHGKAVLSHMCKNIVGMANINAQDFQDIAIAIPPVALQREYVKSLDAVRTSEDVLRRALAEAMDLFNSLVQRAFRGEL
jgi:type I restriction enzyme S subunit